MNRCKPLGFEAARARADQLERERVDAGQAGELVGRDAGQPPEERRREIVMDIARGGRDDVEVVEQPFGGGRHRFLPRVVRERRIDVAQRAHVVLELAQVGAAAAPASGRNREQRREPAGMLLQQLDAEQFLASPWRGPVNARRRMR